MAKESVVSDSAASVNELEIRTAEERDLEAIRKIYNYWVLNSVASFDTVEQGPEERFEWFGRHKEAGLPVIVAERKGEIVGWASLSGFHTRCAYSQTVEPSVYVAKDNLERGVGRSLLAELLSRAEQNGYHTVVALICSENIASISLFAALGFKEVGRLEQVGRKFGRWLDVTYMQRLF
jgi:L-amino acid N-acyltransferase